MTKFTGGFHPEEKYKKQMLFSFIASKKIKSRYFPLLKNGRRGM